jgi:hypothetical protein
MIQEQINGELLANYPNQELMPQVFYCQTGAFGSQAVNMENREQSFLLKLG